LSWRSSIAPWNRDRFNAFITWVEDPGGGTRLGVKDLIETAGLRTTYGSAIFRDLVPERTASCVALLEEAGYGIVGKTNLHEFAYGVTSENPHYGWVRNPLDGSRIAGGSSGGSAAALTAGLCDAALGTDSAGSIRIPAACCGVVGFKPTHGLVSADGVFPLAPSFDAVGPLARSVDGCVAMMRALAGIEPEPVELVDLQVGLAWTKHAEPPVRARVEEAAGRFGSASPLELPVSRDFYAVFMREAAQVHRDLFPEHRDRYGEDVRVKLERCLAVTDAAYGKALAARGVYRSAWKEATGDVDLVLTPTLPCVAPRSGLGDAALRERLISLTYPVSAVGAPALALPCGAAADGLPASLQIVGRPGEDGLVLGAGRALEAALGRPPVVDATGLGPVAP
jgi:aspartyl-tRNA(Asn)/glutamyl-tRNA(Gln) amidotransferase subunit A